MNLLDTFAAQINFHDIKAAGAIAKIFVLQEDTGRLDDFFLLAKINRLDGQPVTNV